jgi:hypothetical protein
MSKIGASAKKWTWAPEVLESARRQGVESYLDPMREATGQLFPEAPLRVFVGSDPEIAEDEHLVWEACIDYTGVADFLEAERRWIGELCRVCPAPLTCVFRLILAPVRNESS